MLPHHKKSINQAHLETGLFEQIVSRVEKELDLNRLEAPDDLQINTVTQKQHNNTQKNPNQLATTATSQVTIETSAVNSTRKRSSLK